MTYDPSVGLMLLLKAERREARMRAALQFLVFTLCFLVFTVLLFYVVLAFGIPV